MHRQCSPHVPLVLEERQGGIRSAEVHCDCWKATVRQHQGRGRRGGEGLVAHR